MKKIRYDNHERRWYIKSYKMIYYYTRSFKSYLKNMIQKIFLTCIFLLLYPHISLAQDCETLENEFEKYECRSDKVCKGYNENKRVFNIKKFESVESYSNFELTDIILSSGTSQKGIQKAVEIYKENMNSIYKCAII
jgi:hypothetical protein